MGVAFYSREGDVRNESAKYELLYRVFFAEDHEQGDNSPDLIPQVSVDVMDTFSKGRTA